MHTNSSDILFSMETAVQQCDANMPTLLLLSLQLESVTAPETAFGPSRDTTAHPSETGITFLN